MSDDKRESLRQRVTGRRQAAREKLNKTIGGVLNTGPAASAPPPARFDQATLQAASAMIDVQTEAGALGGLPMFGEDTAPDTNTPTDNAPDRPAAPTGSWRCIVHSRVVVIDLVANISEDETLSAQGTLLYPVTNKIYEVSGKGYWTVFPPDSSSPKWLFKFTLQPSTHAIFSWFANPTDSPNHMTNRFVLPEDRGVVETNCEKVG